MVIIITAVVARPARSRGMRNIDSWMSVSPPRSPRRRSQRTNANRSTTPPRIKKGTTENPNGVISVPPIVRASRGWIQPQSVLCTIPSTASARPPADSSAPTRSSFGAAPSRPGSRTKREASSSPTTITTSAAKTTRQL